MLGWFKRNRAEGEPADQPDPVATARSAERLEKIAAAHLAPYEPSPIDTPSAPMLLLAPPNYRREVIGWIDLTPAGRFEVAVSSRRYRRG